MPERIVDFLEAIEVHHQHGHGITLSPGGCDGLPQAIGEQNAIRQTGERIGHLGFSDVGQRSDQARGIAVVPDRRAAA